MTKNWSTNQFSKGPQKKNSWLRYAIATGVLALFLLLLKSLNFGPASSHKSVLLGQKMRELQVSWLATPGEETGAAPDFAGKVLVLNFWASWCSACKEEAEVLESFWQKYRDQGVVVAGIAVHDEAADVREFVKNSGKSYAIAVDQEARTALDYGVSGVPETFFIDASGAIRHKVSGPLRFDELESVVAALKTGSLLN